jgi:hypothetical protein
MKQVSSTWRRSGVPSLGLLAAVLLGTLTAAQADNWSFKLINAPTALNKNSPGGESIRLSGGGTFDPAVGMVAACGTFTIFNGFDHPNGPIVHGTWHSTSFVSFTTEGGRRERRRGALTITLATEDQVGGGTGTGTVTILHNGIAGPIYAEEPYIIPPGGSGGGARFEREDDETFFPLPL